MEAKATKEATVIKEAEKNKLTEVIDKDEVLKEAEVQGSRCCNRNRSKKGCREGETIGGYNRC